MGWMLIKRILFPVDFCDRSRGAASFVEEFVGRFQAELTLLAVVEPYTYYDTMDKEQEWKKQLETFGPEDFKFFRVNRVLLHGDAAQQIVDFSRSHPTDLIMMPTQGKGMYRRFLLGSVTAKVLHDADCPVWTGTHMEDAPPIEKISIRRILCAVDRDPVGVKALRWSAQLAEDFQAELSAIHVVPPGADDDPARAGADEMRRNTGVKMHIEVERGEIVETIRSAAERLRADLLIIGRSSQSGTFGRLTANSYSIIRLAPCPVISV
jgi:nucleotide-binding universal stress UspA family protein